MNTISTIAVALPVPLRRLFNYLPAEGEQCSDYPPGTRVEVPFGRRQMIGVVMALQPPPEGRHTLRQVSRRIDSAPLLARETIELIEWTAGYYHHPIGEVVSTALPTALRKGEPLPASEPPRGWRRSRSTDQPPPRARRQHQMLQRLDEEGELHEWAIDSEERKVLAALEQRGLAESFSAGQGQWRPPPPRAPHQLNVEQQAAVDAVRQQFGHFATLLLEGVTGSGKTEVYLELIESVIGGGHQVLVLLPEIGLTPQWVRRFEQRLQRPVALIHSALNDRQRLEAWQQARSGEREVVIGTRSALFTPLPGLRLIIIDEEHDAAFKQQEGLRYSARDLAVVRARMSGCPLLLGSATPSLESLYNARRGRYQPLRLNQRAGGARPPAIELIDCRERKLEGGISSLLLQRIERHLASHGQVLLFINRRGYAPTMICRQCGWIARCQRCDVNLTWHHERQRLACHHCGSERHRPHGCEACGATLLQTQGVGIEQVEEALANRFPEIPTVRIDRDSTRRKGALEQKLTSARRGEQRLLLGTQMLAKGHHLPEVTLVTIINADGGLFAADFRASERMAQLIIQVAGRAGRAERPGEVVIQTHHPDHPLLQSLIHRGYRAFAEQALAERQAAALPPCSHLALLRCEGRNREQLHQYLTTLRQQLLARPAVASGRGVELLGPVAAPMERRNDRFRAQLLLESSSRSPLHATVSQLLDTIEHHPPPRTLRWSIDIDPIDLG